MSLAISTEVQDGAGPALKGLAGRVAPRRIAAEVGPRLTRLMQRHFRSLGQNKKGWPSTSFYGRAAEATNWQMQASGEYVDIVCNQIGIRQRLMGGEIKPVNAGALTIPASPDAAGKTAREFSDLKFSFVHDPDLGVMRPALIRAEQTRVAFGRRRKDGTRSVTNAGETGGEVMFWLAKGARQDPDPTVLPADEEFERELDRSVDALLADSGGPT